MSRPIAIIDVDGVVSNFVQAWLDVLEQLTGERYSPDECIQYDYDRALGISKDVASRVWRETEAPGYAYQIEPYWGAVKCVKELDEIADIVWCTTPVASPTWTYDRERWLQRHFGVVGRRSCVIHCTEKERVRGDVFVDDKPTNVYDWQAAWPTGTAVLWDQPWNRGKPGLRCPSGPERWAWLVDLVKGIAREGGR